MTYKVSCAQVVNRSFLDWARGRLQYVQELQILPFKGSSTDIVTQRCLSSSLSEVLAQTPYLQRLRVPLGQSLDAALLSRLPQSLREVSISITFDDSCLLDSDLHVGNLVPFSFPRRMPHLQILELQVSGA
jgi:hypothetical protein